MLKRLISLMSLIVLVSVNVGVYAAPLFYGQSYGFVVSDPAAFVAAMDKYRASAAGQQSPAMPVLGQNIVTKHCEWRLRFNSPDQCFLSIDRGYGY